MVTQYPHNITISRLPEYTQGEDGNFATEDSPVTFASECRAEPAGANPVIKGVDGEDVTYSWIVYMPMTAQEFQFGDPVEITLINGSKYASTLKRQSNGQFNTRLWV